MAAANDAGQESERSLRALVVANDDAAELERIHRFLTRPGPRFGMAMVTYADRRLADEVRDRLAARVREAGLCVACVEFQRGDERQDLVQRLVDASAEADVLFVVGLDRLVTDISGRTRRTSAIANLNQRRDQLPTRLDARVVFWVANSAYLSLVDVAWDFCRVMLTMAELRATGAVGVAPLPRYDPRGGGRLDDGDERPVLEHQLLELQLLTLTHLHDLATEPRPRADAAASVADLAIRLGRIDLARTWLERAISAYLAANEPGEVARQTRRLNDICRDEAPADFEAMYLAHYGYVVRILRRLGVDESHLEDGVQDVMNVAARRFPRPDDRISIKTWLFGIASSVARAHRRQRDRAQLEIRALEQDRGLERVHNSPVDESLTTHDARHLLLRMLDELEHEDREIYVLVELEGLAIAEIADKLHINENTLVTRLRRARRKMAGIADRVLADEKAASRDPDFRG